jgi:hypothetical protein
MTVGESAADALRMEGGAHPPAAGALPVPAHLTGDQSDHMAYTHG